MGHVTELESFLIVVTQQVVLRVLYVNSKIGQFFAVRMREFGTALSQ
jgi:hypothetical protein